MSCCYLELKIDLPLATNLKEKRAVLKSLITRISKIFNVSISEIDFNDVWKSAKVGIAIVSNSGKIFDSTISNILEFIEINYPEIQTTIIYRENF